MKHYRSITNRIPYVKNAPLIRNLTITPGWLLVGLAIFLRGAIVLSAGTASGTSIGDNPGQLLGRITVDAEPLPGGFYRGGRIVALTPRSLKLRRKYDRGFLQPDFKTAGGITGAAATTNLNTMLELPFAFPRMIRPIESALRLDQFANILLTVNTQDIPTQLSGNDRTVDYSQLFVDIVEVREYKPDYYPEVTPYQSDTLAILQAANARYTLDQELPKTESYVDALIYTETTNQALADTIINRTTAFSGQEQFDDLYFDHMKGFSEQPIVDAGESMTGVYHLPISQGSYENAGLLSGALPDLKLVMDVNNPGGAGNDRINVYHRRVAPRQGGPANKKA